MKRINVSGHYAHTAANGAFMESKLPYLYRKWSDFLVEAAALLGPAFAFGLLPILPFPVSPPPKAPRRSSSGREPLL